MPETNKKLKDILSRREVRYRVAGGEIFAGWGILNLAAVSVQTWLWNSVYLWLIMIAIGIPLQTLYIRHLSLRQIGEGFTIFWSRKMNELWISFLIMLSLLIYWFPFMLRLYPDFQITIFVYFWLSLAMFCSSLLTRQTSLRFGALVFFAAGWICAWIGTGNVLPYVIAIILGLVVPGVWSKYEEIR